MARRTARRLPLPLGGGVTGITIQRVPLPQVHSMGLVQLGPKWRQLQHHHEFHELAYVRRGHVHLEFGASAREHPAGSMYFFAPGEDHGGRSSRSNPAQVLYIGLSFPRSMQKLVKERWPALDGLSPMVADLSAALKALGDVMAAIGQGSHEVREFPSTSPVFKARVLQVLSALLLLLEGPQALVGSARERELAESLLRELELAQGAPPSLNHLARKFDVSPRYLGEVLGTATGQTFPEALAAVRVRNAKALLADAGIPIREIAQRVGLSSPRALARLFRRVTGESPSAFRNEV